MAKIFKTISLEERWKASVYNTQPVKPMPVKQGQSPILNIVPAEVEQGNIQIKVKRSEEGSPTAQLKQMVDPIKKNSELLKQIMRTAPDTSLPVPIPFDVAPLTQFAIPFTNTKFRSAISLADRLDQPKLGSTTHLASYFLSDQFTDYITITPFGVFNHTSDITLLPFDFTPQQGGQNPVLPIGVISQGGLNPTIFNFNSLLSQGVLFSNGSYTSITTITQTEPAGTYIIDPQIITAISPIAGALITNPQTLISIPPVAGALITDPQTDTNLTPGPDANLTIPSFILGVVPSTQTIAFSQGIIAVSIAELGSIIVPIVPPGEIQPQVPGSIVITTPTSTVTQGGTTPTPIVFEPERTSPILNVLRYEAQRALAFFTPRIVHGSADLSASETVSGYFQNNITVEQGEAGIGGSATEPGFFQKNPPVLSQDTKGGLGTTVSVIEGLSENNIDTLKTITDRANNNSATSITGRPKPTSLLLLPKELTKFKRDYEFRKSIGENLQLDPIETLVQALFANGNLADNPLAPQLKAVDTNKYFTLSYDQITTRGKASSKGVNGEDFRKVLIDAGNVLRGGNGAAVVLSTGASVNVRGVSAGDDKYDNDFVLLRVHSIRDGRTTQFRAFLTSFSDSVTVNWNDINYVGRQDTLKAFKGSTRGGSIGFKVACLREEDLSFNYQKLNDLIKSAGVGAASGGALYVKGPLCQLTVGNWFKDTPVIFNSIKYDVQAAEYSWSIEANKQVPHIIDVSLDFVVLGDVDGNPLNASTNKYLNYAG